ncbi:MAG TPA: aminotransferase class I/II-fold pyridoxal phosphate-dependent enzyme [Pyrinomonadaceae bacterium]|nr:aminotransferase class I/II-fold pyridoxal phosphate-dependent enzyme [Pyrinomonadaceae bacterium]
MERDEFEGCGVQTLLTHGGDEWNRTRAVNPPIWMTTSFTAGSSEEFAEVAASARPGEFYTRYGNPTHQEAEAVIARLEGGEAALLTSSGMGAVFAAILSVAGQGDHVIAQREHYSGTATLFAEVAPRFGVEVTLVDQTDAPAFADALRPDTRLIYVETPTNPLMRLTDLGEVARLARESGVLTLVDNTFATPVNQRPLALGFDAVIHSATKYLGGHHDLTAGCVVGTREFVERAWRFALVSGATLSPFDGWLLLRGLRTLGLRVARHNSNALALARFLEAHPKVGRVYYPGLESHPQHELARAQMSGFTGMLSVELRGGYEAAVRLVKGLRLADYAASLGGFGTLVVHPAAMWGLGRDAERRERMGVGESLVRVSVGLEDEADLVADFEQALEA